MKENNVILNKVFTQYVLKDLIEKCKNEIYDTTINKFLDIGEEKNQILIKKLYEYMGKNYRNEYFYQNTLLNKLLLGKHSLNTTTALTQIPIAKSKADFILINGKAVVYEIKTELDTFERLKTQLKDYYKAFDHVCVVTCENNYKKLEKLLENTPVGIYILTNRNTLKFKKEPIKNIEQLEHKSIFKILHKKEYENILLEYFQYLPNTTPVFYYRECYNLFSKIPLEEAYNIFLKQLKNRNKIKKDDFIKVPYELKSLLYFYNPSNEDYLKLDKFLRQEYII